MKSFVFAVVVLVALQGCVAKVAKKPVAEPSPFEELTANAQNVVNNITYALGIKELPDSKKVAQVLTSNIQTFAENVQEVADKLKGEVKAHQGKIDNVIKSVQEKLSETATSLQKIAGPEATAKAKDIQGSLDNGLKTVIAQVDKLVKAVEPDATKAKTDIQNVAKTLLDQIVSIGNNLQTQVKATIAEHEKTH